MNLLILSLFLQIYLPASVLNLPTQFFFVFKFYQTHFLCLFVG